MLAKKGSLYTEKDAAVVVRQMLKVAAECHLHGLVHRDMKPENFLFKSAKEDSHLKATDFGLSDFIKPDQGQGVIDQAQQEEWEQQNNRASTSNFLLAQPLPCLNIRPFAAVSVFC